MLCLPEIQSLLNRCVDNFPGIFRGLKDSDIHSAVYFTDGVATTPPKDAQTYSGVASSGNTLGNRAPTRWAGVTSVRPASVYAIASNRTIPLPIYLSAYLPAYIFM